MSNQDMTNPADEISSSSLASIKQQNQQRW